MSSAATRQAVTRGLRLGDLHGAHQPGRGFDVRHDLGAAKHCLERADRLVERANLGGGGDLAHQHRVGLPGHGGFQIVPPAGLERVDPHRRDRPRSAPRGQDLAAERARRGPPLGRAEILKLLDQRIGAESGRPAQHGFLGSRQEEPGPAERRGAEFGSSGTSSGIAPCPWASICTGSINRSPADTRLGAGEEARDVGAVAGHHQQRDAGGEEREVGPAGGAARPRAPPRRPPARPPRRCA